MMQACLQIMSAYSFRPWRHFFQQIFATGMGNPRSVPVQILQIIINLNYSPGLGFPNPVNEIAAKTEILLTIMSSLSQEESRSISENVKWGQRKRFADGKTTVAFSHFLGYDQDENGNWVVNEDEAKTVREIFRLFLEGLSSTAIANKLTEECRSTPGGQKKWNPGTILRMLKNEKYKGDALLQKFFTVDYLTKKIKPNEGEVPQYYVQGHHPAIIDPETFDLVQTEIERRFKMGPRYSAASIFSSKIVCRECGSFYGSKVWHSNDKYRKVIWRCNAKYKEHGRAGKKCSTLTLTEDEIKEAFVKAMNICLGDRDEIIRNMEEVRKILGNTDELEKEKAAQAEEMNVAAELIRKEMDRNARVAQDQKEYDRKFAALEERYRKAEAACREADEAIHRQGARNRLLASMIRRMKELDGTVTEFDADLWGVFVERMTVMADGKKVIRFKDGMEIEV